MSIIAFEGLWGYPGGHLWRLLDRQGLFIDKFTKTQYLPWDIKNHPGIADVIIGYSYGADTALSEARANSALDFETDVLFTIDLRPQWYRSIDISRPPNVKRWINLYQHTLLWGKSCPEADENIKIDWTTHMGMCEHMTVEKKIKETLKGTT
jgi:hypothetical protein